ncbi:MAG: putative ABC transporter permease [Clostridia bacterium]|nr:putative ABC transporter permease [Clostridia bacterium]
MTSVQRKRADRACRLFLLAAAVSFLGWFGETVYAYLSSGRFCDRGFLTLPVCPIYGISVFALYWLLGLPQGGGVLLRRVRGWQRLLIYVPLCFLIPTAAELVTGWTFHRLFGLRLWDYSGKLWNFGGYICLSFSVAWGILLPLGMAFLFPPLKRFFFALKPKAAWWSMALLLVVLAADLMWILCQKTLA